MAKNIWDEPIGKNTPWDGDASTDNLPVRGRRVEEFIKGSLNNKIGELYYDTTNNRYLAFSDEEDRDLYIADPTRIELVLGTFDAPFNYTAEVNMATPSYNAIFIGATGNYIDFTFDIKNKQGASTGESVIVKYSFIRGTNKQEVSEIKAFGSAVHFNIDKYLSEGTNTIIVSVTGQNTLAATSVAITYEVVNLQLSDELDISKCYNLINGPSVVEVQYSVSGYGTKIIEWYIDGELLPYVKSEDEIVDSNTTRVKRIQLSNLSQGVHSLQFRAYTTVNGERFYTDTLYRDIIVYTGVNSEMIIAIAMTIPTEHGIIPTGGARVIYNITQYVPYTLRFATYSPMNASNTLVNVRIDDEIKTALNSNNGVENNIVITTNTPGEKTVSIEAENTIYDFIADVKPTTMKLYEITDALTLDFTASGKTNSSPDKDTWTNGEISATLTGFAWNNASGWVDNRLEMSAGCSIEFDYAPLENTPTDTGKTIEVEWSTKNVNDDNAVICDLRNANGVGIVIYATKVEMTSADGVTISTEYKSDENVRVAFVINRATGATNQRMSFIYANGIVSRGEKWAITDSYTSNATLKFVATDAVEVSLKSIRIYDAAISNDNVLNNYILYRDTISEMMEVYDRNDVYEDGRDVFSPTKMSGRLPVMIVTGDIPTLENTSDKNEQIVVDIEYVNMQDPTRSFRMEGAAMRPQGTSSMGYPKKNFRIYTQKLDDTILYDYTGAVVKDRLYSFKQGSQPVSCWCLKADYAESSGTHNTGIARLWNKALFDAQIDGEYKLRTEAQRIAAKNGYEYDVRTTIDGFPILLFYRPSANDDVIFIGKYNFNNDKSTESVFGFTGIPDFDNTRMQCWEVLNNGNPLALFTTTENFDTAWTEAFESRYPDTKYPNISDLKAFALWMATVTQQDFAAQKWEHFDIYKMAAYWVYLMRHAGADQFVKNAMFTSEDGQHFYYILYDNDTINGLVNTGHLQIRPTDTRQTVDASGSYVFAGHDSRLWNMLEADEEFMSIVSTVDNALYSAGISYNNTIKIFDEEQAGKWVEKVYNQDATYKYISPYVEKGVNNLFMLQGKRDLHRRWWLAKRFAIYDAKYVSGQYKSLSIELKCINGTDAGQEFIVAAGYPLDYGYGINNLPREYGVSLDVGESHTFRTSEVVNLGDPIRIYGAPNIAELDLSAMADRLAVVTVTNVYEAALGSKLTKLVLGRSDANNLQVSEISGLRQAIKLEHLDVQGMKSINSIDLSAQRYFKTLKAHNTNIASVILAKGAPVERLELPASMRTLTLDQLPILNSDNLILEDVSNIQSISIKNCPNISNNFDLIYNWYTTKTTIDKHSSLVMDNVLWTNVDVDSFLNLIRLKLAGTLDLKGKVVLPSVSLDVIYEIQSVLGDTVFYPTADLFVEVPSIIGVTPERDTVLEGESTVIKTEIYPIVDGTFEHEIIQDREGCSVNADGVFETNETAIDSSDVIIRTYFHFADGGGYLSKDTTIRVERRVYPSEISISGNPNFSSNTSFLLEDTTTGVNGTYSIQWVVSGSISDYYHISIANDESTKIVLVKDSTPNDTVTGVLSVNIIRAFDNAIVAVASMDICHDVIWPDLVKINGDDNPVINNVYDWSLLTEDVTGIYTVEWSIEGDVTQYVDIAEYDDSRCVLQIISEPYHAVSGNIVLTLKKAHNSEVILEHKRAISAIIPGVVINSVDNAPIQAVLYNKGLVANQNYSLKEEVEKITYAQLNPDESSPTSSIFYASKSLITHFEEFEHFTSVTKIPKYCFSYLTKMSSIVLPSSVKTIASYAFGVTADTGSGITSLVIPDGVTSIGGYAFYGCSKLINIEFPNTLTSIGEYCFYACYSLSAVELPESITSIGARAFYNCNKMTSINIPSKVKSLGAYTFRYCRSLKEVVVPSNITSISTNLFEYCSGLEKATILGSITNLANNTFASCSALKEVYLPDSITSIGNYAFTSCSSLEYLEIPKNCASLGTGALSGCTLLREILCTRETAPTVVENTFGSSDTSYVGINVPSSYNKLLRVPQNATGYESSYWGSVLLNPDMCGYNIYGKIVINTNHPEATFNIRYDNIDGTKISVDLPAGTSYLQDVAYGSNIYASGNELNGYKWEASRYSVKLGFDNYTLTINAYIYPVELNIVGDTNVPGGTEAVYTAVVSPINTDVPLTYTWTKTGSSNVMITSAEGNTCFVSSTIPNVDEEFKLTCEATSITPEVSLVSDISCVVKTKPSYISAMYNVSTTNSATQLLGSSYNTSKISYMEIDGEEVAPTRDYTFDTLGMHNIKISANDLVGLFMGCGKLLKVDFSECNGSDYTSFRDTFRVCSGLEEIIWGNCVFPKISSFKDAFYNVYKLSEIDLTPFTGSSPTDTEQMFYNCSGLKTIDVTPLSNGRMQFLNRMFYNCSSLTRVDLSALNGNYITSMFYLLNGCTNLTSVILPNRVSSSTLDLAGAFDGCANLTSIDLSPLSGSKVKRLSSCFSGCEKLESIDFTMLDSSTVPDMTNTTFSKCFLLKTIKLPWLTAPEVGSVTFGNGSSYKTGKNVNGAKTLYVPSGATGYDQSYWKEHLLSSSYCNYTLSATL